MRALILDALLATAICLWIAILVIAISVGGNVFQMVVIDPIWSASPPESVRSFFSGTPFLKYMSSFHLNPIALVGLLCLFATPILAWSAPKLRNWLLLAVVIELVIVLGTVFYIYPINDALFVHTGDGLDAAAISAMARRWLLADRIRLAFKFAVFLCLLRAVNLLSRQQ